MFLLARREDKIKELAEELDPSGQQISILAGDVTQPQDLVTAVEHCLRSFGKLDIAIANAGFGVAGNVSDLSIEDYRTIRNQCLWGFEHGLCSRKSP
ncbi:SDR family NAD(P)-dependent oxidoreductase [bacterium]|nr:SDR family NAD(P)-dependent oxidoreductase [bacterium]